jgi:hypothetical protein
VTVRYDTALATPADARSEFARLGLHYSDPWARASLKRIDDHGAAALATYSRNGQIIGPEQQVLELRAGMTWPKQMHAFVMDWMGRLVPTPREWPPPFPALDLGGLTIEARRRLIWDGSDVLAEVYWNPQSGDTWSLRGVGPPADSNQTRRAEQALQWLLGLREFSNRTGRPAGRTDWPKARFVTQLDEFCRKFACDNGRAPTQEEASQALEAMPIQTFRYRFGRYITKHTRQNWDAYTATYLVVT